ncbi:STAS domain-containing protein [Sphingomonas nostoxanthinifaciens]|uniref:STAS domain-containing protein n=1 Tax=Sphingomonas nostoxanthinifaciens TaxID=2872652 RepID=UPI0021DAE38E|nr:STAS domain-containing protein [Sphingomonas nostoxanthinifaciens]
MSARIAAGEPIALDGSAVEMLGQACLQVLASACRTAEARGLTFVVRGPSHALSEMCTLVGFDRLLAAA